MLGDNERRANSALPLRLGLLINPLAGLGGAVALKGSDGADTVREALERGAKARANERVGRVLDQLGEAASGLEIACFAGDMGESAAISAGLSPQVVGRQKAALSSASDTEDACRALIDHGIDLLLFAGGDGTARDICRVVGLQCPVLGIPAGVKMQSAVYAVSPEAAGQLLVRLLEAGLVDIAAAEVRDLDEELYRQGQVKSRYYGELLVPAEGGFLQQVKQGGIENEELVASDIAADIVESMDNGRLYLLGAGTTTAEIGAQLGVESSLLGVDAIVDGELIGLDLSEKEIWALLEQWPDSCLIISVIGGQGHILGRGNQQLSPRIIRRVGLDNLTIVATKTKLTGLAGRPLLVDSNDPSLDRELKGYRQVITGYHDAVLYPCGLD